MFRGSRADEVLTLAFMVLAIAAGICYFTASNKMVFITVGGIAVAVRIVQYIIRFFK